MEIRRALILTVLVVVTLPGCASYKPKCPAGMSEYRCKVIQDIDTQEKAKENAERIMEYWLTK